MKKATLVAFAAAAVTLTAPLAHAAPKWLPENSNKVTCETQVDKFLGTQNVGLWTRIVDPAPHGLGYRTSTGTHGKWVEFHQFADGRAHVFIVTGQKVVSHFWNGKDCKAKIQESPGPAVLSAQEAKGKRYFFDKDLKAVLDSKKSGLVYVWSPGMVYSMKHYQDFKTAAKKMKIDFIPLMDPSWDQKSAKTLTSFYNMPLEDRRVASVELTMRNATIHFPSSFVYANGHIGERIIGVYTPDLLEAEIKKELSFLTTLK